MLRFKLGSIPVTVHPTHFLFSALLGLTWVGGEKDQPASTGVLVALWVAIIFISVLVHELGHALVSMLFGYRPTIELVGLGGLTRPNSPTPIPWLRDIALTLAGPTFGFALGVLSFAALYATGDRWPLMEKALTWSRNANIVWAIYNLLPVTPLDGGRISSAFLMRLFGKVGFLLAQILSLLVSIVLVLLAAFLFQQPLVALFMALYGFTSFRLITAYFRGEAPADTADFHTAALAQLGTLLKDGKLDEARQLGTHLLENELPPPLRGKTHHLLGWVALRSGQGRLALDHFSQAQNHPVEPQALATAFAMVGDDERAVSLWELAYKENPTPASLHEWAAALIRTGREPQAKGLPQVDWPTALTLAQRIHFKRGEFAQAAKLGEQNLAASPAVEVAYDTACAHARAGNPDAALRLLEEAERLGFTQSEHAAVDQDLASLRANPTFEAWLLRVRNSARA